MRGRFFAALLMMIAAVSCLILLGCRQGEQENSLPKQQDLQWKVSNRDTQRIPFQLSGKTEEWNVLLQVRACTEEEKELLVQQLESTRAVFEENYRRYHLFSEEQYRILCEKNDKEKADIRQNTVYLSTMTGRYTGQQPLKNSAQTLTYQLVRGDGATILSGGQDMRSLDAPWYLSYNTEQGEYAANVFVPPADGYRLVLQYGDKTAELALRLE